VHKIIYCAASREKKALTNLLIGLCSRLDYFAPLNTPWGSDLEMDFEKNYGKSFIKNLLIGLCNILDYFAPLDTPWEFFKWILKEL
jgi:hypothetical protein